MTKETFIELMTALENQNKHDKKCSEAFKTIFPNDFVTSYDNHWLNNALIGLLQKEMNDEDRDSWIEYYMYELDFGKKYYSGCALRKDGSEINLSNAGELYDFLMENI